MRLVVERPAVLWYGRSPYRRQAREFEGRELVLRRFDDDDPMENLLPSARALVIPYDRSKPAPARRALREWAALAGDHGVLVIALIDHHSSFGDARDYVSKAGLPKVKLWQTGPAQLAHRIAWHVPGPPYRPGVKLEFLTADGKRPGPFP